MEADVLLVAELNVDNSKCGDINQPLETEPRWVLIANFYISIYPFMQKALRICELENLQV